MADYHRTGVISALHRFPDGDTLGHRFPAGPLDILRSAVEEDNP